MRAVSAFPNSEIKKSDRRSARLLTIFTTELCNDPCFSFSRSVRKICTLRSALCQWTHIPRKIWIKNISKEKKTRQITTNQKWSLRLKKRLWPSLWALFWKKHGLQKMRLKTMPKKTSKIKVRKYFFCLFMLGFRYLEKTIKVCFDIIM